MEHSNSDIRIVCYTGGTCGDLVAALIDPGDTVISQDMTRIILPSARQRLKKPHLMRDDQKDLYLTDISNHYASIPSHDLEYHVSRRHDFIGIVVTDDKSALWAASRFKSLHREQVWIEMQKYCNANSVETYAQTLKDFSWLVAQHSKNLISLEDIKSGNAITTLELILGYKLTPESEILYERWLKSINLTL